SKEMEQIMRLFALYKTFSGNEFVIPSIESIYPFVTGIIMIHSEVSWSGVRGNTVIDKVKDWCNKNDKENKIYHIFGKWTDQNVQYFEGLKFIKKYCKPDWIQIIDTDEVWEKSELEKTIDRLKTIGTNIKTIKCKMHTYVKDVRYRISPPEPCMPVVFIRGDINQFSGVRFNTIRPFLIFDDIYFHHYTYVREKWQYVKDKIITSHIGDLVKHTNLDKWKKEKWDTIPNCINLHTTNTKQKCWKKIIEVEPLDSVKYFTYKDI
ncbi:MAG: hypothetical protein ACOC2U_04400, partial [bacterium]